MQQRADTCRSSLDAANYQAGTDGTGTSSSSLLHLVNVTLVVPLFEWRAVVAAVLQQHEPAAMEEAQRHMVRDDNAGGQEPAAPVDDSTDKGNGGSYYGACTQSGRFWNERGGRLGVRARGMQQQMYAGSPYEQKSPVLSGVSAVGTDYAAAPTHHRSDHSHQERRPLHLRQPPHRPPSRASR